jgi:uncharacterized protein
MLAKDANGLISSQFARLQVLSTYLAPQEPSEAYSETGQCDCACAEPMLGRLEQFDLSLPIALVAAPDAIALPLTNEHYLLYNPIAGNLAVLNRPALDLWSAYAQANTLDIATSFFARESREIVTRALRQMVSLALLQTVPSSQAAIRFADTSTLSAWLHITDQCNLRCAYCYLPHRRADMSPEIGCVAIDAAFRSALAHSYRQVKFKYAGGEPLLRFPLIIQLHRYAQAMSERYALNFDEVVLSNGTLLTSTIVKQLQSAGLRLMISLDGVGRTHDCQRHFANGQGSFDKIERAIDLALSHGLVPTIAVTVTGRNADRLPELMVWILARDLPFALNLYRENDLTVGQKGLKLEETKIIQGMTAAYQTIETKLPCHSLLTTCADRANLLAAHLYTCNAGRSNLVFDWQGRIAKCQMDMAHSVCDIRDPDPLASVRQSKEGIQNLKVDDKAECRNCQWRYWCGGGCPLQTYRTSGRYDTKSPNCNIYKALFPQVLRLEGLRLLKYATR